MKTIHAIFENGIFRPTEPVDLPEGSEVTVEPCGSEKRQPQPTDPEFAHLASGLRAIYATLSHRYEGRKPDAAEKHNEHQP